MSQIPSPYDPTHGHHHQEHMHSEHCGLCRIELEHVSVSAGGDTLLNDVNMHIHCGQLTALVGPNGAGKTTLVRALLSQIPHTGQIRHMDNQERPLRSVRTGYVPQRVREEGHALVHRHGAQQRQQRGQQQQRQQRVFHKGVAEQLKGQQRIHHAIYGFHALRLLAGRRGEGLAEGFTAKHRIGRALAQHGFVQQHHGVGIPAHQRPIVGDEQNGHVAALFQR